MGRQSKQLASIANRIFTPKLTSFLKSNQTCERLVYSWKDALTRKFIPLRGGTIGNKFYFYNEGSKAFGQMWKSIDMAKERVWMQVYELAPDPIGLKTIECLTNAAKRGCNVLLIYDGFGSISLNDADLAPLLEANGVAVAYHHKEFKRWGFRSLRQYLMTRNHRKLLVVDNDVGFCGGMNTTKDYVGVDIGGTDRFRDSHLQVMGPIVYDLSAVFLNTIHTLDMAPQNKHLVRLQHLHERHRSQLYEQERKTDRSVFLHHKESDPKGATATTKENEEGQPPAFSCTHLPDSHFPPRHSFQSFIDHEYPLTYEDDDHFDDLLQEHHRHVGAYLDAQYHHQHDDDGNDDDGDDDDEHHQDHGVFMQVLETDNIRREIQKVLSSSINEAKSRIYLTTPYFFPPSKIASLLVQASARGIDVRILTAGKCDVPIARSAAQHVYGYFLKNGVKIYEYQKKELHAKLFTVDGLCSIVGSYNLDRLSFKYLLDGGILVVDPSLAHKLEEDFLEDQKHSKQVTIEDLDNRSAINKIFNWACFMLCRFSVL